jgi:hypothetical protein
VLLVLSLLLLGGFWVRLCFLKAGIYYADEFITMLAAKMVAERGLPILPSGLFYDQGLPFSLVSGALIAVSGFREEVARWPSLLIGVFTIGAYYAAGRRIFSSRLCGLLAAALFALDPLSIVWSGRARMYSLAHLLVLLSLTTVMIGIFKRPSRTLRLLFVVVAVGAVLSHNAATLIVLPIGLLVVVFSCCYRRAWLRQPGLWWEALVGVLGGAVVIGVFAHGQLGSTVSLQDPYAAAPAPFGLEFLRGFFLPGLEWSRFDDLVGYLTAPAARWMLPVVGLSLAWALYRLIRRRVTFSDVALLFLILFLGLLILEQGALLTRSWQRPYLLYIIVWPAFLMVCAFSLARVLQALVRVAGRCSHEACRPGDRRSDQQAPADAIPRRNHEACRPGGRRSDGGAVGRQWPRRLAGTAGLMIVVAMWGPSAWDLAFVHPGTGDYNTAFEYVRQNRRPGDRIMSIHPSAAYLYAGQCDYYANQVSAKVLEDEQEEALPVDRYTGSPLIDTVDGLNRVLASGDQVWFVVDQSRLFRRYEPFFLQQILAQMDIVHTTGGVLVFVSRAGSLPLPEEPTAPVDGDFAGVVWLEGYSLAGPPVPGVGATSLGLFWRPVAENPLALGSVKVFVQVRNQRGETVAQADHFVYQGLLTIEEWSSLRGKGEWLRDAATLHLAQPSSGGDGPHRIFVGLYDPQTMARVPVLNDASGENAVMIDLAVLP